MNSHSDGHPALGNSEERFACSRQRAPGKGNTEGAGVLVRAIRDGPHLVEACSAFGRPRRSAEHRKIARNSTTFVLLGERGAEDVVGHSHSSAGNSFGDETRLGLVEVENVTGIVAIGEQDSSTGRDCFGHGVDLLGRWRGKDVAHRGTVRETFADNSGEGWVVTGATANHHGHVAIRSAGCPNNAALNFADERCMCGYKTVDHFVCKFNRVVIEVGHESVRPPKRKNRLYPRRDNTLHRIYTGTSCAAASGYRAGASQIELGSAGLALFQGVTRSLASEEVNERPTGRG